MGWLLKHKHKWQIRGRNRYGLPTYRMCLKCREPQKRINKSHEHEKWEKCNPIKELDNQFNEKNEFRF